MSVPLITDKTVIDRGLALSNNFLIDHVSTGAFHTILGKWMPHATAVLDPAQSSVLSSAVPLWKVFASLQQGANGILENLLREGGSQLNIQAGFLNKIPATLSSIEELNHLQGMSFDIGMSGYDDNVYNIAKDIQRMAKQAESIDIIYGSQAFFHINFDPKKISQNASRVELPRMRSIDLLDRIVEDGIQPFRGYV